MSILEDLLTKSGQERSAYAPFWPEENREKSLEPVKQSISTLTSTTWNLSFLALEDYEFVSNEITNLAANSVESNIFFEPQFLQAGIQRIEDKGVMLACLWEGNPGSQKLRFMMPLVSRRAGLPRHRVLRSFAHHFAPLGTPLLHRDYATESAENLLRLLGDPNLEVPPIIAFDQQRIAGPTVEILRQAADNLGLAHKSVLGYQRAQLCPLDVENADPQIFLKQSIGKKRHKEYARLLRRLNDKGTLSFKIARTNNDVLDAIEGFLTLEARGWKGRSGTALYSLKEIAAFSRQAISALAKVNRCEIHTMNLDNKIIAALVCFKLNGEYFTWKIAFDEDYDSFSPGVQIMLHASAHWLSLKSFKNADSLAAANHKMIDHLWRNHLELATLLIETGKSKSGRMEKLSIAIERHEKLRELAKSILARLKQALK